MEKKKKKVKAISADDTFVRGATFTAADGKKIKIMHQPYAVGMYSVVYENDRMVWQGGVEWKKARKLLFDRDKFAKMIADDATDVNIWMSRVGDFLDENELKIANGE